MKWFLALLLLLVCLQGQTQPVAESDTESTVSPLERRSRKLFLQIFTDPEAARIGSEKLLSDARSQDDREHEAEALRFLGIIWSRRANFDSSAAYFSNGRAIAEAMRDTMELVELTNSVGTNFEDQGKLDSAEHSYLESLHYLAAMKDNLYKRRSLARVYINLGNLNQTRGELVSALDFLNKAKAISEANNFVRYLPAILYSISEIELALGEYQLALDDLHRGLRSATKSKFGLQMARIQLLLGEIALHFQDFPEAQCYFEQSLDLATERQNPSTRGRACSGLAFVQLQLGNLNAAEAHARTAQHLLLASKDTAHLYTALGALGEVMLAKGQFSKASEACARGLANANASQSMKGRIRLCACLSKAHAGMGDFQSAYKFSLETQTLKDSLLSTEKSRLLARQEARYFYAQQRLTDSLANIQVQEREQLALNMERERHKSSLLASYLVAGMGLLLALSAALAFGVIRSKNKALLLRNNQIAAQKGLIEQALGEKDVLLSEVHHRVKNNLQVISSLLELQSRELKEPAMKEVLQAAQLRIQAMALIHRKLYQGNNFGEMRMPSYVQQLANEITGIYQGRHIGIEMEVADVGFGMDTTVVLGLILNELILNAFRHAFPEGESGRIKISLKQVGPADESFVLSVSDNGRGLPPGFDPQKSPTLGLQLVAGLAKQIKGDLEWRKENGTYVQVIFKAAK